MIVASVRRARAFAHAVYLADDVEPEEYVLRACRAAVLDQAIEEGFALTGRIETTVHEAEPAGRVVVVAGQIVDSPPA